jgi:hypothetical protein
VCDELASINKIQVIKAVCVCARSISIKIRSYQVKIRSYHVKI